MKILILIIFIISVNSQAITKNGFELDNSIIHSDKIYKGGPPKDGIPALYYPRFVDNYQAMSELTNENERAIIVEYHNIKKAYPISILNWHEIINDKINEKYFLITYCPLCGSGIVFDMGKDKREFGVSGLLYQSDVLLYDKKTNSLWSQIMQKAISGPLKNDNLLIYHSKMVNLKKYLRIYPNTTVMTKKTKYASFRDYEKNPYKNYENSNKLYFPIDHIDSQFHPKTWTLYINYKSHEKLIPITNIEKEKGIQKIKIGNDFITIVFNKKDRIIMCQKKKNLKCITGFWFALKTFFPYTELYR
jgi:hypothetical protein